MPDIVLISGSPSAASRSAALLNYARLRLTSQGLDSVLIHVRDFPPADLLAGRHDSAAFTEAKALIAAAAGLVVGTPIYQAAYAGALKTFLDILPRSAFSGKIVLPLATGGSPAHLLAIDYALKPVLSAMGATDLLQGVYATDDQVKVTANEESWFHGELSPRLHAAVDQLGRKVQARLPAALSQNLA